VARVSPSFATGSRGRKSNPPVNQSLGTSAKQRSHGKPSRAERSDAMGDVLQQCGVSRNDSTSVLTTDEHGWTRIETRHPKRGMTRIHRMPVRSSHPCPSVSISGKKNPAFGPFHFPGEVSAGLSGEQQDPPTPHLRRIISSGQKFVNEDCRRLNPTNAVNQSQFGL
jgi:hypothetical protein